MCADDVLENVNLVDDVKAKENIERKKAKPVYSAYDDDEFDEHGNPRKEKKILSQYDEEIEVCFSVAGLLVSAHSMCEHVSTRLTSPLPTGGG